MQINSIKVNLFAQTTAVWPMKGRVINDQNTNTIHENIQQIQYTQHQYL